MKIVSNKEENKFNSNNRLSLYDLFPNMNNKIKQKEINDINSPDSFSDINETYIHDGYIEARPHIFLTACEIITPYFCFCSYNKNISSYNVGVKYLENEMKISRLLNRINQIEKIKENVFSSDQLHIFDKLFCLDK